MVSSVKSMPEKDPMADQIIRNLRAKAGWSERGDVVEFILANVDGTSAPDSWTLWLKGKPDQYLASAHRGIARHTFNTVGLMPVFAISNGNAEGTQVTDLMHPVLDKGCTRLVEKLVRSKVRQYVSKNWDELVEDILPKVFPHIHKQLHKFDPSMRMDTWLRSVVYNKTIDELRKRKLDHELPIDPSSGVLDGAKRLCSQRPHDPEQDEVKQEECETILREVFGDGGLDLSEESLESLARWELSEHGIMSPIKEQLQETKQSILSRAEQYRVNRSTLLEALTEGFERYSLAQRTGIPSNKTRVLARMRRDAQRRLADLHTESGSGDSSGSFKQLTRFAALVLDWEKARHLIHELLIDALVFDLLPSAPQVPAIPFFATIRRRILDLDRLRKDGHTADMDSEQDEYLAQFRRQFWAVLSAEYTAAQHLSLAYQLAVHLSEAHPSFLVARLAHDLLAYTCNRHVFKSYSKNKEITVVDVGVFSSDWEALSFFSREFDSVPDDERVDRLLFVLMMDTLRPSSMDEVKRKIQKLESRYAHWQLSL
jgi:DNA-directed RNA polymerase specialized sigma24 family protein